MGDWLVKPFTIFGGIAVQNWMPLALAIILLSAVVSWWLNR